MAIFHSYVKLTEGQRVYAYLAGSAPTARWGHTMEGYDTVRPLDTVTARGAVHAVTLVRGVSLAYISVSRAINEGLY